MRAHEFLNETIINEAISTRIRKTINDVRNFLQNRFADHRYSKEELDLPISYFNCFPSAEFLSYVLNKVDPVSGWHPVNGKWFSDSHAFVVDKSHMFVADVTGDQFGEFAAILIPLQDSEYEIIEPFKPTHYSKIVSKWIKDWDRLKNKTN
jgi:hypothetical protein